MSIFTVEALRTPDDCFASLPDFPYAAHHDDALPGFEGLRMAYLDEGPKNAAHTFLCLHGEPTWSFLYRHMIPVFLRSGGRVVAPDLFGFGRSDKPVDQATYTFSFHRRSLLRLIETLDLQRVTMVVQDWGGLLGLTLPIEANMKARFDRLIVMNTGLAVGEALGEGFASWRAYVAKSPNLEAGKLIRRGKPELTDAEIRGYDAPYPDQTYKAGVRAFPQIVMTDPQMDGVAESKRAATFWSDDWRGQSFMAIGEKDPVFDRARMEAFRTTIHGCPPALLVPEAGHFVQEWGAPIAEKALASFGGY